MEHKHRLRAIYQSMSTRYNITVEECGCGFIKTTRTVTKWDFEKDEPVDTIDEAIIKRLATP